MNIKKMFKSAEAHFSKEFGVSMKDFDSLDEYTAAIFYEVETERLLKMLEAQENPIILEFARNELEKRGELE